MIDLKTDIKYIKGVGEKRANLFYRAGIKTAEDLLYYFPRDSRDFSKISKISEVKIGEEATFKVKVSQIKNKWTRRRFVITEGLFSDSTGTLKSVWFNQSYIANNIKKDDELLLAGKLEDDNGLVLKNPIYEIVRGDDPRHLGRIVPIYKESGGLSSRMIRYILKPIINNFSYEDYLPSRIRENQNLEDLDVSLKNIHFPETLKERDEARRRLAFDEIFIPQVLGQIVRRKLKAEKSFSLRMDQDFISNVYKKLSFSLTSSQKIALTHIFSDLAKDSPMNRLLEGDVGSGKTMVAVISILAVVNSGFQAVFMVPTEVLAWEHLTTLNEILGKFKIKAELITGSTPLKEKNQIYEKIKNGEIKVLVGTHALLNEKIEFKNLALAVIDEQHRFGVSQRKKLREKNGHISPHLLSMTATPIPRTFALTVYGDLDISVLTEMPKGERKTKTYLTPEEKRESAYNFIKEHLGKGSKALVICPSISLSDKMSIKAVEDEFEKLSKGAFKDFKIGFLHGKMKTQDKQEKIEDFKKGKIEIMISTTVIEVGLNIPNLNVMMIENAERFGLAQLHQLRGRIGRAGEESFFLLFTESHNPDTLVRLKEMEKISDGFKLAEFDLSLRGEGDLFGTRQSGMPEFRLASFSDFKLIEEAHSEAEKLLREDPELIKYSKVKERVSDIYKGVHAE